jgi:Tfp pilus assembly protein PilV
MPARLRSESGFLVIELLIATVVLTIAVLALLGSYDESFLSLRSSAKASSAGLLAQNQLELYDSLTYSSIGFTSATLSSTKSTDPTYSTDETALPVSGTDVTITTCATSPQCSPVQTLTGDDHRSYKLETFIRSLSNPSASARTEKIVTVVVRNLSASACKSSDQTKCPKVVTMQTGFDAGSGSP